MSRTQRVAGVAITGLLVLVGLGPGSGCAPVPAGQRTGEFGTDAVIVDPLAESPAPDGPWRPHRLAGCAEDGEVPPRVERYLGISSEYYRDGSGSDGMIELELGLQAGVDHSLLLLTLGQLYLLAGQGDPALLPVEGPAADVGDWNRNKRRLLGRARDLLTRCRSLRPDDAAVDYLLADVERAAERFDLAAELVREGRQKCTGGRSFRILKQYQQLFDYPARYLGGPPPDYPQRAVDEHVTGDVVLDLLISPAAEIRQCVVVGSPDPELTQAAEASVIRGTFEASRVGKYPIWSWLRVTTSFNLDDQKDN